MKQYAIIPIFIPHKGCPNDCVFCNQRKITAHAEPVRAEDIHTTVEQYMSTLSQMNLETIELSFFGGSFTGLPIEEQNEFLAVARDYKERGVIDRIRLSTRPDYIDEKILDNLKAYGVDVIELGVQSFVDDVLKAARRGHDAKCVYESCSLIKSYGFSLGIQLMVGLPGSSAEADAFSAMEAALIKPDVARLYPTVVIKDTELAELREKGLYRPMSLEEAVSRTAEMYRILASRGINIIRVGLKASDVMCDDENTFGTFHPAFRQLVESRLARESLEAQIEEILSANAHGDFAQDENLTIGLASSAKSRNCLFGYGSGNKKYFAQKYPGTVFKYLTDAEAGLALPDGSYKAFLIAPDDKSSS